MKTIYIIQDSGQHNFSSLYTITENIVVICNRDCPLFGNEGEHIEGIKEKLKYFNPAQDFLVLVGDPVNIALCVHEVLQKGKGVVLLKYDRQAKTYIPIKLLTD
jgi:hypothetical protein